MSIPFSMESTVKSIKHPVYSLSLRFTGILHNPDFIHETLAAVVKDYATYK